MTDFGSWLRAVDNIDRPLTKTEYKVIVGLMEQTLDYRVPHEVFDRLHWFLEIKDTCKVCGGERCGCEFHQQSCSHVIRAYMEDVSQGGM